MTEIHIAVEHTSVEGKSSRQYRGFNTDEQPLFTAFAIGALGRIEITFETALGAARWLMKPRRSFTLTGKYDVRDANTDAIICIPKRNGTLTDANDQPLAQLKNARSLKSELAENVFDGIVNALLTGEGVDAPGAGPHQYVLMIDGEADGSWVKGRLPFFIDPPKPAPTSGLGKLTRKVLPKSWTEARPPMGWKLSLGERSASIDPRLLIVQSIVTTEMSRA